MRKKIILLGALEGEEYLRETGAGDETRTERVIIKYQIKAIDKKLKELGSEGDD